VTVRIVPGTGSSAGRGAMDARRREVVMTVKGNRARLLKLFVPGLVDRIALAALKDDVEPR
jgi:hypothetical protein